MNFPIRMKYRTTITEELEVDVYDFYHTPELESFALCWVPSNSYWITIPIYALTPVVKATSRSILNEEKSTLNE